MAETVELPFAHIGDRRGITRQQMIDSPELRDFYLRFKNSFEVDINADVVLLIEPSHPSIKEEGE